MANIKYMYNGQSLRHYCMKSGLLYENVILKFYKMKKAHPDLSDTELIENILKFQHVVESAESIGVSLGDSKTIKKRQGTLENEEYDEFMVIIEQYFTGSKKEILASNILEILDKMKLDGVVALLEKLVSKQITIIDDLNNEPEFDTAINDIIQKFSVEEKQFLQTFAKEALNALPLSSEEEREALYSGNNNKLINSNKKLIMGLVLKYAKSGHEFMICIQESLRIASEAIISYKVQYNISFSTYIALLTIHDIENKFYTHGNLLNAEVFHENTDEILTDETFYSDAEVLESEIHELEETIKLEDIPFPNIIKYYLQGLTPNKHTSYEEGVSLCKKVREGDEKATDVLIANHIYLIASVANRCTSYKVEFEDLIQEGIQGLMIAVDKYVENGKTNFSTYAYFWIKQTIYRWKANHGNIIRIPVNKASFFEKMNREIAKMTLNGIDVTPENIAKTMNITVKKAEFALKKCLEINVTSLDVPVKNSEFTERMEFIPDDTFNPEEILNKHFVKNELSKALTLLTEKEEKVLRLRYGIDDGIFRTLDAVGKIFGVTRERIRQIETKALKKLRTKHNELTLKPFYNQNN